MGDAFAVGQAEHQQENRRQSQRTEPPVGEGVLWEITKIRHVVLNH